MLKEFLGMPGRRVDRTNSGFTPHSRYVSTRSLTSAPREMRARDDGIPPRPGCAKPPERGEIDVARRVFVAHQVRSVDGELREARALNVGQDYAYFSGD